MEATTRVGVHLPFDPAPTGSFPLRSIAYNTRPDPALPPGRAANLRRICQMDEDSFTLIPPFDVVLGANIERVRATCAWIVCSNIRAEGVSGRLEATCGSSARAKK